MVFIENIFWGGGSMPRNRLGKETVTQATMDLIEQEENSQFLMAKLAQWLHIKTMFWYNHIDSLQSPLDEMKFRAISQLAQVESTEIEGKKQDKPLFPLREGYRSFEWNHIRYHWQRVLRGWMVKFAFHEHAEAFSRFAVDKSIAAHCIADGLRCAGRGDAV